MRKLHMRCTCREARCEALNLAATALKVKAKEAFDEADTALSLGLEANAMRLQGRAMAFEDATTYLLALAAAETP
jgi:hypothetical protein